MRHVFLVDGTAHEVWLSGGFGRTELHLVDDPPLSVALDDADPLRARLRVGLGVVEAAIAATGDCLHVHLHGRTYEIVYREPIAYYGQADAGAVSDLARAPMPGAVISVAAAAGRIVAANDVLLVIESMKMEVAIRAPRDGVVAAVHFAVGQSFERDAVLVTLAPRVAA